MTRRARLALVHPAPGTPAPPSVAGLPHDPARRGFVVTYHRGEVNHCPGCGRSAWLVGRLSAECAFCGCAVGIAGAA